MLLRAITTRLVDRHLARRLVRVIPHPGLRAVATVATSVLVPLVVERLLTRVAASRRGKRPLRRAAVAAHADL